MTVSEAAQDAQRAWQELIDNERRELSRHNLCEFPDMPATRAVLPARLRVVDGWQNDSMPFFVHEASGVGVWVDFSDPAFDDGASAWARSRPFRWRLMPRTDGSTAQAVT